MCPQEKLKYDLLYDWKLFFLNLGRKLKERASLIALVTDLGTIM